MDTERKPETRWDAGQTDDEGVKKHGVVEGIPAELVLYAGGVVHKNRRYFADGRSLVRVEKLEFFESVKELREPDHQSVVAEKRRAVSGWLTGQTRRQSERRRRFTWMSDRTGSDR